VLTLVLQVNFNILSQLLVLLHLFLPEINLRDVEVRYHHHHPPHPIDHQEDVVVPELDQELDLGPDPGLDQIIDPQQRVVVVVVDESLHDHVLVHVQDLIIVVVILLLLLRKQ